MTKENKERLSNRLVLNFGILLAAGLVLLYVNTALRSGGNAMNWAYLFLLITGILSIVLGLFLLIWGKLKKPAVKNYSAVCLGTLIGSAAIYITKFGFIPGYDKVKAVICVYIAMAIYFVVMAVITAVLLHKPTIKSEAELVARQKKLAAQKKKKKKKK